MFGFWIAPTVSDERQARQIVEPRRDVDDMATMSDLPEENGRDIDYSGATTGRGVRRDVSGANITVAAQPSDDSAYNDGSAQARLDESWSTKGYYAAKEEAGQGGKPGVFTSIAVAPFLGTHHILGGVTQLANDRVTLTDTVIQPVVINTGDNTSGNYYGSTIGASADFANGLWG